MQDELHPSPGQAETMKPPQPLSLAKDRKGSLPEGTPHSILLTRWGLTENQCCEFRLVWHALDLKRTKDEQKKKDESKMSFAQKSRASEGEESLTAKTRPGSEAWFGNSVPGCGG